MPFYLVFAAPFVFFEPVCGEKALSGENGERGSQCEGAVYRESVYRGA